MAAIFDRFSDQAFVLYFYVLIMEAELEKTIQSIYDKDPSISGLVITDDMGLCLATRGSVPEEAAGLVASIASNSESLGLAESNDHSPVVQIEAERMNIIIKRTDRVTIGIFKS